MDILIIIVGVTFYFLPGFASIVKNPLVKAICKIIWVVSLIGVLVFWFIAFISIIAKFFGK